MKKLRKHFENLNKKLINSSINALVEELKPEDIHTMFMVFEKEIVACPLDVVPESIKPLEKCLVTKFEKIEEILLAETLMIFALQKSLENACSLLYTALIGDDLRVFNNDNIFSIDKNYTTICHWNFFDWKIKYGRRYYVG